MKPGSEEWYKYLTGSQFAAAIGINPYKSRQKLFREIKKIDPPFEGNPATDWGTEHEPDNISEYEVITGDIVTPTGFHQHPTYDWVGVTPDGLVGNNGLIEAKCPFSLKVYDDIPVYYMPQIQGQIFVTQRKWCDFAVWTPDDFAIWRVSKSEEYWVWAWAHLKEFWAYVEDNIEPKRRKKPVPPEVTVEKLLMEDAA